ncbi:hypothetical protein BA953_24890 (plasmid) [Vibrio coralliilyticus]|uniref:aerolysin family beta-barrel pore-forming toxin n=1 Tax=Vibrio coralliilyticus TaxID=190893 RepID=UPI000810B434|nr:aerolysin family beta-barrel pore-forming toxin [Vibrio coralliilyticus]ANW27432.1 hypothetical protein BA953_24890 [Vibrio coralliilyticus]
METEYTKYLYSGLLLFVVSTPALSLETETLGRGIFADQLVRRTECESDESIVTLEEANAYRYQITNKMGQWEITAIGSNHVIKGLGYHGRIMPGSARLKWCHPNEVDNTVIFDNPLVIPAGSKEQVDFNLVNNQEFYKPLTYIFSMLGYAWLNGNSNHAVGEDMEITKKGDSWQIKGRNIGPCSGFRCHDKSKITVSNIEYKIDPGSIKKRNISIINHDGVRVIRKRLNNNTDNPQVFRVAATYTTGSSWTKSEENTLSGSVSVEQTIKIADVSETKIGITIGKDKTWGESTGGNTSQSLTSTAHVTVPANSSADVLISIIPSVISYDYSATANISYDVKVQGFLRWGFNAWHTHPKNRPNKKYEFAFGKWVNDSKSMEYEWANRNFDNNPWDWVSVVNKYGFENTLQHLRNVLRPKKATILGSIQAEGNHTGEITVNNVASLEKDTNNTKPEIEQLVSDRKLERLGITNLKVEVTKIGER